MLLIDIKHDYSFYSDNQPVLIVLIVLGYSTSAYQAIVLIRFRRQILTNIYSEANHVHT
jgi:hypothetical protein